MNVSVHAGGTTSASMRARSSRVTRRSSGVRYRKPRFGEPSRRIPDDRSRSTTVRSVLGLGGAPALAPAADHALARALRTRRADRRRDVLLLFRRRKHRGEAEMVEPELSAPALRVVEVLVLLVFHFLLRVGDRFLLLARQSLRDLAQELPVL